MSRLLLSEGSGGGGIMSVGRMIGTSRRKKTKTKTSDKNRSRKTEH